MDSLGPLRARAAQLTAAAQREKAAAVQTYETSARPALKEHAASLKESLGILMREEAALQERVDALASRAVAGADPSVRTGFNVIRARTGADGQSLPTEELRAERQRLVDTLDVLGQQVEQAKVEITRHAGRGRHQEQEIWETQLVALQVRHGGNGRLGQAAGRQERPGGGRVLQAVVARAGQMCYAWDWEGHCTAGVTRSATGTSLLCHQAGHQARVPRRDQPD